MFSKQEIINLVKSNLVRNSGMVFIAMAVSGLFTYIFRILLARNLSLADYGLFFSINSALILILTFANFGMGETYIKYFCQYLAEKQHGKLKGLVYFIALSRGLLALLLFILCYYLSDFLIANFFRSGDGKTLFLVMAFFNLLTSTTFNFIHVSYRSMNLMKEWGMMRSLESVMLVIFTSIGFLYWKIPMVGAVAFGLSPLAVSIIFGMILVRKLRFLKGIKAEFNLEEYKKWMFFSVGIVLMAVCNFALNSTDTLMLTYFSDLESVALYQAALPLARAFLIFTTAISIPLYPYITELYARKKFDRYRKTFYDIHRYSSIFLFPLVIAGILFSRIAITIFFGQEYAQASAAFGFLIVSMFFMLIFNIHINFFMSSGRLKAGNIIIFLGAVLNLALDYPFILWWDYAGAAFATLVVYLLMTIAGFIYCAKKII